MLHEPAFEIAGRYRGCLRVGENFAVVHQQNAVGKFMHLFENMARNQYCLVFAQFIQQRFNLAYLPRVKVSDLFIE